MLQYGGISGRVGDAWDLHTVSNAWRILVFELHGPSVVPPILSFSHLHGQIYLPMAISFFKGRHA